MSAARRTLFAVCVILSGFVLLAALVIALHLTPGSRLPMPRAEARFSPVDWSELEGWNGDAVHEALPAFLRSCDVWNSLPDDSPLGGEGILYGTAGDWREVCARARALDSAPSEDIRLFFERSFRPYAVSSGNEAEGLFTGYYEPELQGSLTEGAEFGTPLYKRPPDLVHVELGDFRDDLKGRRIAGRVVDGRLKPFESRAEIDGGALPADHALAWVDPVDAFFLHIQGSGRVVLRDGSVMRVGYDGQNGHPYTAIARILVQQGVMTVEEASMARLKDWLRANPNEAPGVMAANASYVFFKEVEISDPGLGPLGSQGVPLTAHRSLAVDATVHAMGALVWLDASIPGLREGEADRTVRQLMVAQDTGGAIRGPVRGDYFWGFGEEAGNIAGRMRHRGRMYVLVPAALARSRGEQA
jgi:membrane-bound lytic murein transglycosylase A